MAKSREQKETGTVTILTVTQVHQRPCETRVLTLAFASRERAIDAIRLHLANPEAATTITIHTLDVITREAAAERTI